MVPAGGRHVVTAVTKRLHRLQPCMGAPSVNRAQPQPHFDGDTQRHLPVKQVVPQGPLSAQPRNQMPIFPHPPPIFLPSSSSMCLSTCSEIQLLVMIKE